MREVIYNQKQLEKRLKYWQKKLRLQDWIIRIVISRERDMENDDAHAETTILKENKQAYIRVLDSTDFSEGAVFPQDMEWSIIHELLHLHFCNFDSDEDERNDIDIEQSIESITSALIALERK